MGGFFGAASKDDCVFDLFFGTDYHSHLGTRRGGICVYNPEDGFNRAIHNIENSPFRTKFDHDIKNMKGHYGIGCISDYEPQPLIIRSHHGTFAITTVGKIGNRDALVDELFSQGRYHFMEHSGGEINQTELVAMLINQKENIVEGIQYAQEKVEGSISMLLLTPKGIYCARDKFGRTPVEIGKKEDGYCASFEAFAYMNLGYEDFYELGPGEVVVTTPDGITTLVKPGEKLRICTFLWIYYGYPSSRYEGRSVEQVRYNCGREMAIRDREEGFEGGIDTVAGIPDSGIGHALGYATESHVPYSRPFIKYTPTWARSFMPTMQSKRNMIAKMKLIPVQELIHDKKMMIIDDSIVRGTQLRETGEFLFASGAEEIHARPACPPILYGCKYLNFSRSRDDMDLIARRVIRDLEEGEVTPEILAEYADPDSERYQKMVEAINEQMGFTTLRYNRLDDMIKAVGMDRDELCTYCWDGRE